MKIEKRERIKIEKINRENEIEKRYRKNETREEK